jgi:hypothetical protein
MIDPGDVIQRREKSTPALALRQNPGRAAIL